MSRVKAANVLQSVAECAVKTDVGQPDVGYRRLSTGGAEHRQSHAQESKRGKIAVHDVVDHGSHAWTADVTEHGEIRNEEANREESPRACSNGVRGCCDDERRGAFGP